MEIHMAGLAFTRAFRSILLAAVAANWATSAGARPLMEDLRQQGTTAPQRTAAVSGKVEDPSGAVIVGATVTFTPTGAGERHETTTDTKGVYRFERVQEGSYLILVFRDGFAPLTREVVIAPEQTLTLDFKLEIASFKEEVTVAFTA